MLGMNLDSCGLKYFLLRKHSNLTFENVFLSRLGNLITNVLFLIDEKIKFVSENTGTSVFKINYFSFF